jgi:carboxyl-terminal processing protease
MEEYGKLMNPSNKKTVIRSLIMTLSALLLCACISIAAFFIGRQTALSAIPADSDVGADLPHESSPTNVPQPTPTLSPSPTPEISEQLNEEQELLTPTRTPMPPISRENNLQVEDLDLFFEVWDLIVKEFDGELPSETELIYRAINGSLDTLSDEHTRFIPPDTAARMREDLQGSFEGIGAFVRMAEDGHLQIVRPIAGQPAALAGLLAEDIILAVDGVTIKGMTIDEAISLVRGPRGTSVTLSIARAGLEDPFEVTIVRQLIEIPTVEAEMLPESIAYVRLTQFNSLASQQLQNTVSELLAQRPQALIFDLRDNPGGFLDQAVAVADIFLPEGVVLYERNMRGLDETFQSRTNHPAEEIPLVVLVNAGSASASELVAGAIQDRSRGILIGETTFGKGSVQQTRQLSDGSELRVTIARWYTPNDRSIDQVGIIPDIEISPSPLEFGGPDDTQLQRAIEYILRGE